MSSSPSQSCTHPTCDSHVAPLYLCSAGYVATGFWGGITLGRAIATPLNSYSGLKRVIFLYLVLATGLEVRGMTVIRDRLEAGLTDLLGVRGTDQLGANFTTMLGTLTLHAAPAQFSIWFARSYIGNAVVVALVGVLLGPLYPIVMVVMSQLLPRSMHASGIGFAAAFGQVGSAVFPFITGELKHFGVSPTKSRR